MFHWQKWGRLRLMKSVLMQLKASSWFTSFFQVQLGSFTAYSGNKENSYSPLLPMLTCLQLLRHLCDWEGDVLYDCWHVNCQIGNHLHERRISSGHSKEHSQVTGTHDVCLISDDVFSIIWSSDKFSKDLSPRTVFGIEKRQPVTVPWESIIIFFS